MPNKVQQDTKGLGQEPLPDQPARTARTARGALLCGCGTVRAVAPSDRDCTARLVCPRCPAPRDRRPRCEVNEGMDACEHCGAAMRFDSASGRVLPVRRLCTAPDRRAWKYEPAKPAMSDLAISLMI